MKTYFIRGNYKVIDFKDQNFAKYEVTETNRCFNNLDEAILYCIGSNKGNLNDSQLQMLVDTFMTMINNKY